MLVLKAALSMTGSQSTQCSTGFAHQKTACLHTSNYQSGHCPAVAGTLKLLASLAANRLGHLNPTLNAALGALGL